MTDQQATTEQTAPPDQETQSPAATAQPAGTRELRDAQQASQRGSADPPARPPIKASGGGGAAQVRSDAPLFDEASGSQLRDRWLTIQTEFVDEPRDAVQKADALVAEVLRQLTDTFAREREELEAGWSNSADGSKREVSTEDLRMAIQRYRSFFNRLLAL